VLVTTIIPVYNRAAMLRAAVACVLAQTYRPIEIVIVDDGSTDDTFAVAEELARRHPEIVVVHQANAGPGAARESGRRIARGELIQHLDSDDIILPRKFELQVAGLAAHPECGVSYGITCRRLADGSVAPQPWGRTAERIETMFPAMLRSRWWATITPLYRVSLLAAAGPWTNLRMEEDWEYDARIAALGVRLHFVEEVVAEQCSHNAGNLAGHGLRPDNLRYRAAAHESIFRSARRAGITNDAPEMQHFARELFLLARQAGAAGLTDESKRLFALAREASAPAGQLRVYGMVARLIGWRNAGRIATMSDHLRWRKSRS
jgi:glycosyltransferase involved in cell wall biosynthesis